MVPAPQDDRGKPAGPSSFVSRIRTNLEKFTKARRSEHQAQAQWNTEQAQLPVGPSTQPSLQPLPTSQSRNFPTQQRPRVRIPTHKRWSASSAETYRSIDGSDGSSPTTLVGSPDSWSWKSDSEWSPVSLPNKDSQRPTSLRRTESREEHEVKQDAEMCNHQSGSNSPNTASSDAPSPQPSSSALAALRPRYPPHPLRSPRRRLAQRSWPRRLPEDAWYLVAERLDQHDLAHFAAVCRDTRFAADSFLHRNPIIRNAQDMVGWEAALAAQPKRRQLVQSLTIGWYADGCVEGDADTAYVQMTETLHESDNLKIMTLFAESPEGRFATKRSLPRSVRTLNASAGVFLNVHRPLPPLLHLSVNVWANDLRTTLSAIGNFGEMLLQLRLFVKWETPFVKRQDNPTRWCMALKTPRLVYFELREERSETDVPLRVANERWDSLLVTPEKTAFLEKRVPSLRYLVWQPVWGENEQDVLPGGESYDVVQGYRDNLIELLKLDVLALALPDGGYSCYDAGKEDPRDGRPIAGQEDLWRAMGEDDRNVQLL